MAAGERCAAVGWGRGALETAMHGVDGRSRPPHAPPGVLGGRRRCCRRRRLSRRPAAGRRPALGGQRLRWHGGMPCT